MGNATGCRNNSYIRIFSRHRCRHCTQSALHVLLEQKYGSGARQSKVLLLLPAHSFEITSKVFATGTANWFEDYIKIRGVADATFNQIPILRR